ncbi:dynamin family protein [Bacillus sp. JJ1764]|uniref:dynamin family protein n=1 Tax=Bacillus sp. JJ1764 TaxID=3122964 RepID=UPI002FFFCB67
MVKIANPNETISTLKGKIESIYEYLLNQQDVEQAEKVKQLARKMENREFAIAFCGHFSAGKSTMINRVVGENLLPSSPIPTSANLVRIKAGEDYAKVFFKSEKPRLYLAPYDYNLVKNYCKDGDQIQEIEMSHSDTNLPANTVIMDTPGIDSADDAHRIATESAIHLADLIFYVMDYNHVQAELNFQFTKELTEAGKDVYLVINQVDKHRAEELSFQEFQTSVIESFASWGVKPARIFYTSLKQPNHPYNQFNELQTFIKEKLAVKDQLFLPSIFHSLKKIAADHLHQLREETNENITPYMEIMNELTEKERLTLLDSFEQIHSDLETLSKDQSEQDFEKEIAQLMKNAYLMPFQTRELAESYLESCQPEFKVGFLFSKQKTQEEKNARLETFYQDIAEKANSQLEWHIREFLLRTLKAKKLDDGELLHLAQSFSIHVQKELLMNAVKPGARLSGQYVLQYTDDVANGVKKLARTQLEKFKEQYLHAIAELDEKQKKQFEQEHGDIERYVQALTVIEKQERKWTEKEKQVQTLLQQSQGLEEDKYHLFDAEEEDVEVVKTTEEIRNKIEDQQSDQVELPQPAENAVMQTNLDQENQLQATVDRLLHASSLIKNLPGMEKLSLELIEKAERLNNKGFTVALFGAFSAGKSSFANALMGEKVLPVSPNPTTAAINKIKPVTEEFQHGTVLVKFKEPEKMLEDVNRSLKVFELHAHDFAQASNLIDKMMNEKSQEGIFEKTHYAFLMAFNKGYQSYVDLLGSIKQTDVNEFQDFVAKEERSCYVEWIELYYDCELTRKGITLVDTPGADSINARHTGVAFDYIKNSDAILFVTYYNHAFSKADREFLIQLGRVKESFHLDKMFFIINAIDLAENEEEKNDVAEYVQSQLIKYGIRNPHLYPLSSLLALKEKQNTNEKLHSGMNLFEQSFYQFISTDLTGMVISSAEKELVRVRELVDKLILSSSEEKTVKEQKFKEITNQKTAILQLLGNQTSEGIQSRFSQESRELTFYIKQRVFLRFSDFFKEAFNPATLKEDGRNIKKAFQLALDEFIESVGYDFAQEMRATTVRLERFAEGLLSDAQATLTRKIHDINKDLSFSDFEKGKFTEIDFPIAFQSFNEQLFTKAFSYFKNPKAFFEKNEKKNLSDELHNQLNPKADEYLLQEAERMNSMYLQELKQEFTRLLEQMNEQANDYYLSLQAAMEGGVPVEVLKNIQQQLA